MAKQIILVAFYLVVAMVYTMTTYATATSFALPPLPEGVLAKANPAAAKIVEAIEKNTLVLRPAEGQKMAPPRLRSDQSVAIIPDKKLTLKVCGYYCGPNWCANQVIAEDKCVATGKWGIPAESGQVVDDCCRDHDSCCGKGVDRASCNVKIVSCIQAKKAYWSFCGAAVWAAMKAVSGWCCGSACPTFHDPAVPLTMTGKVFGDDKVRITFTDESNYVVEAVRADDTDASKFVLAVPSATCGAQGYTFSSDSLQLHLGSMMHIDTNECGKKLMAATPSHDLHPLLDSPDTVIYWPTADVIAVSTKLGSVHQMKRLN